ncbi:Comt [Symbiodinium microadriaticum]|nr:Comt [Symbiodinium microadriaticum]
MQRGCCDARLRRLAWKRFGQLGKNWRKELCGQRLEANAFHAGALLGACAEAFAWEHALRMLQTLPGEALFPDDVAFASAIAACGRSLRWALALVVLTDSFELHVASQAGVGAAIAAAAGVGEWQVALSLLAQLEVHRMQPDVMSYTQALSAFEGSSCWQKALSLLFEADERGMANEKSYTASMRACTDQWQWSLALFRRLPCPDRRAFNVALNSCAKALKREVALVLLRQIPEPDAVSYNSALAACGDDWIQALQLLDELTSRADRISYNAGLAACEAAGVWPVALNLLGQMREAFLEPDWWPWILRELLKGLTELPCDHGRLCLGSRLASSPGEPGLARKDISFALVVLDAKSCTSASKKWVKNREGKKSTEALRAAVHSVLAYGGPRSPGVALSEVALSCTICAAGAAHRWQVATRLLDQMEDLSVESNAFSFSAAIDACAKASQWLQAVRIFMSMPATSTRCNQVCLNAALAACQRASRWRQALALGAWAEGQNVVVDDAGHHILLCALEAVGHWAAALALVMSRQPAVPAAADAATLAACRALRWQEALILGHAALKKPQPGRRGEVLGALACLCEEQGHPAGQQLFHDLAKAAHASGLGGLSQALATASSWKREWTPLDVAAKLRGMLGAGPVTGRLPYQKEVALLRKVVDHANPGDAASVVHQMECFGVELGSAGGWAKFAAGSKAQILLLGAAGAGPSPKHVLDIGAYGGGSALHLAMALPGVHVTAVELDPVMVALARCLLGFAGVGDRVRVLPGHTRFRLPGLQGQRFSGIFADVWGAQYADVLALIHRHALLSTGSVLIADNVLRTGAAEFAGRVTGPGFHTVVMPVREVANPEEEDWMTVSVLRDAAAWETSVSEELLELQARSEHLRDEATNEGIAPEEHQDFSERAREVFRKVGIAPVSP